MRVDRPGLAAAVVANGPRPGDWLLVCEHTRSALHHVVSLTDENDEPMVHHVVGADGKVRACKRLMICDACYRKGPDGDLVVGGAIQWTAEMGEMTFSSAMLGRTGTA